MQPACAGREDGAQSGGMVKSWAMSRPQRRDAAPSPACVAGLSTA
jgi:hypothetical protein